MAFGLVPVVTVNRPNGKETALHLSFFFFNFGTSSAKGVDALVNVRVVELDQALASPPGDCLGGRRAQVPSQQRVTRYNTCDCTESYLNKRVGCLGEAHARA